MPTYNLKVVRQGTSIFLFIPYRIRKELSLTEGDVVLATIEKSDIKQIWLRCRQCHSAFSAIPTPTDIYDCPVCGNELPDTQYDVLYMNGRKSRIKASKRP